MARTPARPVGATRKPPSGGFRFCAVAALRARQFVRVPGGTWQESPTAADVPFRTASWFRFTPYATAVRLLGEHNTGGRRIAELALMDPGTPVWTQLTVDEGSGRVLRDALVLPARLVTHRNAGFDAPVSIAEPKGAVRGG